ncbi:MAG: hypothetical protein HN750_21330 [Gemmatimonadales bacterium]|mgnify:FL=1|nr:hypothetical protein [Gemmatimonadales bacterium]
MTSTGPGTPDDFDSTIAKLGRELVLAANSPSVSDSTVVQVGILESIADECGRQALRLWDTGGHEPDRMGLYDDEMVVYELLQQGWGHWLYSGDQTVDERLARSVVQVTLATCSICPGFDLNNRASGAIASHCDTSRGRELVYPALEEILQIYTSRNMFLNAPRLVSARRRLESKWICRFDGRLLSNLSEIFNWIGDEPADPALRNDRSHWSFDEGQWSSRRPQEHTDEQADQPDPETSATPPLNPLAVGHGSIRQAMMLYAILGPALTEDLIRSVSASGMQEGTLVELKTDLEELRAGKYPEMLLLMASAAHATAIAEGWSHLEKSFPLLRGGYGPATKFLGDEIVEALRRFGVDPSGDREGYNRWLHSAVKDSQFPDKHGILTTWDMPPGSEENEPESEAGNNTEDDPPRRRARLIDRFNRRVGNGIERLRNRR